MKYNLKKMMWVTLGLLMLTLPAVADNPPDEGMWLPLLLNRLNYVDMQKMGLHLTAEELYNINHSSLKDAIVGLSSNGGGQGFFCTAEVVSAQGLIFTNHHCGFNAVQSHSTTEHDYLTNGFWAMNKSEELSNERMCASFLVRVENVTDSIIPFLSDTLKEADRQAKIRIISNKIRKKAEEDGKYDAAIQAFFSGNEYYLFVYKTYRDVRLVGAPPSSIGKFGGDTDNWMWPRHTGDFTVFRIYTDSAGYPAKYSNKNIPLKASYHLPISLKGIKKNDFAMIWGYPARTSRYLTSYGIEFNLAVQYPSLIAIYGKNLEVMKERMDADKAVKIAYAGNYAGIANTWKNYIGQSKMLKRNHVEEKKKEIETTFIDWYSKDPALQKKYGHVLDNLKQAYAALVKVAVPMYYSNMGASGLDIIQIAGKASAIEEAYTKKDNAALAKAIEVYKSTVPSLFKDKDQAIEKNKLAEILKLYFKNVTAAEQPSIFGEIAKKYGLDCKAYAEMVYSTSVFASAEKLNKFLNKPKRKTLEKDPAWKLSKSVSETAAKYSNAMTALRNNVATGNRMFVAGIREMDPDKKYYPDANSTMRMSYGKVLDYYPADAVHYDYVTTLYGVMQKEDPENEEFIVEKKLKDLYLQKDYGKYGENGNMIVCFLTTNDITGGNSGSPVINADGQLIGLAFDGNWEAMSGDIMFEPDLQRTINVDIRYVLFIIDKFAGATKLIDELTLIQ
ncbi:MAG: S46 family peptidase [Bacteroidetes bacterium]|nr:S46 family peptidase [Bacteroidota bacterium]